MTKRGMKPLQASKLRIKKGLNPTNLHRIRVAKGFSQSELAEISGVPVARIQHYEQRVRRIDGARLDTLCDLSIALNCKIEDLLESKSAIEKLRKAK